MCGRDLVKLATTHVIEAQTEQPDLQLSLESSGELIVRGPVRFHTEYEEYKIQDAYEIEIEIPADYPSAPPTAKETGGLISDAYHHRFLQSGNLCLGAPVEVRRVFGQKPTLLGFINKLLIPALFTHSCIRDYGRPPYGDLDGDIEGIAQYYCEHFGTDLGATLRLLKYLADYEYPLRAPCPCNSLRDMCLCHGREVIQLWGQQSREEFAVDLVRIIIYAVGTYPFDPTWQNISGLLPKQLPGFTELRDAYAKAS